MRQDGKARVPPAAFWLGHAGLIPFAAGALAVLAVPGGGIALGPLAAYGATILAFMGGCRWGFAAAGLGDGAGWAPLALSVLPALWGWAALMLPPVAGFALLAAGFAALLGLDILLANRGGAPAWWPRLRWPLSAGAIAAMLAGAAAA